MVNIHRLKTLNLLCIIDLTMQNILFQGYSRKGSALAYLGRYDESVDAYEEGLKLDPNNAQINESLKEVNDRLTRGKYILIFLYI